MGFYWDELPMTWIRYELGPAALMQYFSTNRPVWGLLYQVTTRLLPQVPIYWQVCALLWRWISALLVWAILRQLWPTAARVATIGALGFLLYPGFTQQWTSFLYGHFLIVLCCLLFSFLCMLWSIQRPQWYWPLTALGMLLSGLNLWMMEYFYTLELCRPFIIFQAIRSEGPAAGAKRIGRVFRLWLPYLLVLMANVLWRVFVFNNQIYKPTLPAELKASPLTTIVSLLQTIGRDTFTVAAGAWGEIFIWPVSQGLGPRTLAYALAVGLVALILVGLWVWSSRAGTAANRRLGATLIAAGFLAILSAGWPFWLTGLDITLAFPANRFTLPFMLGSALILTGLSQLLPSRLQIALATVLLALAAGHQALLADSYRRDWSTQKALFWQMSWRAPGIEPHTILLLNQGALQYFADNSLTAAVNWIYDPGNRDSGMDYVLFYPTSRLGGTLQALAPGQPISYDFIAEVFTGSTSQMLAFYYQPPGCLRLLDPLYDSDNHFIDDASLMREASSLSSSQWIMEEASARMPPIYGPEPVHDWCYYFEQADLAAQEQDWSRVVALGDTAFSLSDYPNDPVERFVFIQGYAHEGDWQKALDLSNTSYKVSKLYVGPLLCRLWNQIEKSTADSSARKAALDQVQRLYACPSE